MQNPFFFVVRGPALCGSGPPCVFVAQMSQMGMNFVDTAMTGQASTADMAAVAVAGSIWNPLSLLGIGCLLSLPAMSAHLVGGGQRPRTPHLLRQGIWLTLGISAILMTALRHLLAFAVLRAGRGALLPGRRLPARHALGPAGLHAVRQRAQLPGRLCPHAPGHDHRHPGPGAQRALQLCAHLRQAGPAPGWGRGLRRPRPCVTGSWPSA